MNIPQKEAQRNRILEYLQEHGSITPMDALRDIGCFRLSARIYDLKKLGWNIETTIIRYSDKKYALYTLKGENDG